jgi:curved DNA-binding protein CbpA
MKFKEYLIERTMTFEKALKVFGMGADEIDNKIALKHQYRKLAMQHHPDKGGDVKMAQDINDAYALLAKASKKKADAEDSLSRFKMRQAKEKKMAEQIKQQLLSDFAPEVFQRYFNEHSGYDFKYEITKSNKQWPGFEVEFFTNDRKTIFSLKVSASITDVMQGGLTSGDLSYTVYTEAHGFHNNKKQKMSKSDWGFTRDHSFLKDPKKLFPPKKMKDIFSGKTSNRAFSKRDMVTYLKTKLKADWDGKEWMRIPLGDDYTLTIFRSTFMRMGNWGVNGIYLKHKRVHQPRYVSFMEEEETAKIFDKIQKEVMKVSGDAKIKKADTLIKQAYEAYRKSKGI